MLPTKPIASTDFSFLYKSPDEINDEFYQIPEAQFLEQPDPIWFPEFSDSVSSENVRKNRYPNIVANNDTRVRLDWNESDYINANRCLKGRVIISQGPLPGDENHADFYHMLWTNDCSAIAMLTNYIEKRKAKCSYYLPRGEKPKTIDQYTITAFPDKSQQNEGLQEMGIKVTKVLIDRAGLGRKELTHYHLPSWEDNQGTAGKVVATFAKILLSETTPLIHCSAGIGRSGTLAATMDAYTRIKKGKVSETLIADVVTALRKERRGCVMNPAQYQTIYDAVKILVEEERSRNPI